MSQETEDKMDKWVPSITVVVLMILFAFFIGRPLYDRYHDEGYRRCPNCTIAIEYYATKCRECKAEFKEGMTMQEIREFVEEGKQ